MSLDRCYGIAVGQLGMSPTEFWRGTPRQLMAAMDTHRKQQEREDYRAGVVASLVFNTSIGKDTAPRGPEHWFPSLRKAGQQSPDQMLAAFRDFAKTHNKRIEA